MRLKKNIMLEFVSPMVDLIKNLRSFKPDVVFNALHGRYGEDGYVQSITRV